MQRVFFILFIMFFLCMPILSIAYSIKEEEWPFIPGWCDYTQYGRKKDFYINAPANIEFLMNKVGKKYWMHIHHYCMALVNIYRSHGANLDEYQRKAELSTAIGGIDYVLERIPKDSIIRPELLTKKGYVFLRLKNYFEAERTLRTAIDAGKMIEVYWPAYGYLADVYLAQGKADKAREILQEGLKVAPNAKGLKIRLVAISRKTSE